MKTLKYTFLTCFLLFSSIFLFACGNKNVPVENISFTQSEVELFLGNTTYLQLNFSPENANGYWVVWSSEDSTIASVNQRGKVTAKAYGQTTITAQIKDTDIKAECEIYVTDGQVFKIELDTAYTKTEYYEGQSFDATNLIVTAFFESGKESQLATGEYQIVAPDVLTQNSQVYVEYKHLTAQINITVLPDFANGIAISAPANKLNYYVGESFNSTGMTVNLTYASGKTQAITDFIVDTTPFSYNSTAVQISYQNFTITQEVNVRAKYIVEDFSTLQSIIDNAIDGDSIMLAEGFYNTSKTITLPADKNIIIYGQTQTTQINSYNAPIFTITGSADTANLTLANLTLTLAQGENISLINNPTNLPITLIDVIY